MGRKFAKIMKTRRSYTAVQYMSTIEYISSMEEELNLNSMINHWIWKTILQKKDRGLLTYNYEDICNCIYNFTTPNKIIKYIQYKAIYIFKKYR